MNFTMGRLVIHCLAIFLLMSGRAKAEDEDVTVEGEEQPKIDTVIGIDLGTTYSCVGVFQSGKVEIIANDQGNRITPSYVAFSPEGDRLIGDAAKNQLTSNPENTIFDVKRLIGRGFSEKSVQKDIQLYPFAIIDKENKPHIRVKAKNGMKDFSPEEVSAMVLVKMKEIAEDYLGRKVTNAVITVPAYFNDAQRSATRDAGTIAGLNVLRIINEPTAAAIAYGIDKKEGEKNILVFDLGGGTFDVSVLTIENGVFEVIATNGDTHLGGEDFDQRVMEYFIKMYKAKTNRDIKKDNRAVQKLRREVEKAKRALSTAPQVRLEIESLLEGEDFSESLTRAKFEELNLDLFQQTMPPVRQVLDDADLGIDNIDEIVLVGGSTRIPKIQEMVIDFFNGKTPNQNINPDEAVAYGAAVQGGVLSGDADAGDVVLLDVNPLTLGLELKGGIMEAIIPRNTVIPTKKTQQYSTMSDHQTTVSIRVYEGERPLVKDNHLLGIFQLTGIIPAPRGVPQIEVTFDIDVNGILKVTAEDKGTGIKNHIVIQNDQKRLSPDDIERMVTDSVKFSESDRKFKARQVARIDFEKSVYSLKQQLTDKDGLGGKLTEEERAQLEKLIADNIDWLDQNLEPDIDAIKERSAIFDAKLNPIVDVLYARRDKEEEEEDDDDDDDKRRDEL